MTDNEAPVFAIAGGMVATLLAATVYLSVSQKAEMEESLNSMLDLPAKHYAAEVLLGASDGMKANGWSNFSIEERLAAVKAATHEPLRRHMTGIYEKAYSQGINGEWDEASLDGYLEVVEMPGRHIYHFNKATLDGDESINPTALKSKIDAKYGARWDDVGRHFREGLEGIILTTVTASEIAHAADPYGEARSIGEMQPPVYSAAKTFGFMTSGPHEPSVTVAYGQPDDVYTNRPQLEVPAGQTSDPADAELPIQRVKIDTTERERVAVDLDRPKIPVTWNVMTGDLSVENPFTNEPSVQKAASEEPGY